MKSKTMLPITLNDMQISDLFFNSGLANYNAVNRDTDIHAENEIADMEKAALLQDATEFADMTGNQVDAADLVEDFLARV